MNIVKGNEYPCIDRHGNLRHRKVTRIDTADYIPPSDRRIWFTDNTGRQESMNIDTFRRQIVREENHGA